MSGDGKQPQKVFRRPENLALRYGCLAAVGVFFVLCVVCSGLYGTLMFFVEPGFFILATILATMTAVPYSLLLLWLDRNEPEPPSLLITAFMWGACVATMVSLVFNSSVGGMALDVVGDPALADQLTASIAAPLFEELSKGVALLLLFFFFRKEFDNVLDGIIYGAFIGLGFAWFENISYYMSAAGEGGLGGMLQNAWVRGVVSASGGSHAAYTAITGCGIGFVRVLRRGALRWLLIPFFWSISMFAHFSWNTFVGLVVGITSGDSAVGALLVGVPIAVVVLQLPFTFLLFVTVLFAWRHEHSIIRTYLKDAAEDVVTPAELAALVPASRRTLRQFGRFFREGPSSWWHHRSLARYQIALAFLKWHHARDGIAWTPDQDHDILRLREQIRRHRSLLR